MLRNANPFLTSTSSKKNPWYLPIISIGGEGTDSAESNRIMLYRIACHLASYIMVVDYLDGEFKSIKDVTKNTQQYIPNEIYSKFAAKLIGSGKIKGIKVKENINGLSNF